MFNFKCRKLYSMPRLWPSILSVAAAAALKVINSLFLANISLLLYFCSASVVYLATSEEQCTLFLSLTSRRPIQFQRSTYHRNIASSAATPSIFGQWGWTKKSVQLNNEMKKLKDKQMPVRTSKPCDLILPLLL